MARSSASLLRVLVLGGLLAFAAAAATEPLDPRIASAEQVYREQGAEQALPMFERLVEEFETAARRQDLAAALHYIGECHWRLGNLVEARRRLDRALALEHSAGDRLAAGRTLNVRGLLSWDEGNYERAVADFRLAGEYAQAAGDRKLEGASLNNLSLVYDEQGDYDVSLEQYRRVLELYRGASFPRGVGDTLGNIGGVNLLLGRFREALGYYRQALEISEQLRSTTSMSQDHGNIALCLLGMGEIDEALGHLDQAAGLALKAGMRQDQAYWLRVKAEAFVQKGDYDLALQSHRGALALYEQVGARAELAEALGAVGRLYLLLGDSASAEREFRRSLDLSKSVGLDRGVSSSLISLGDLEFRRRQTEAAEDAYEQARQRSAEAGVRHTLAVSLLRLARVHRATNELAQAQTKTDRALAIAREIGARGLEGEALYSLAELARLQRRANEAIRLYGEAERAMPDVGDPDLLWQVQFGRARAQKAAGEVQAAMKSLEMAIATLEAVRNRLQEPRFRSGYLEDKTEVYLELMQLQLEQGSISDAFSTAERLRARNFVEQLGGRASVPLSAADRRMEAELRERVWQLNQAATETDADGTRAYPERATDRFRRELHAAESEYATFLDDRSRVRGSSDVAPSAASVQGRLDDDEALLEYVVGTERGFVFVLTRRDVAVKSIPLREAELAARVALLRDLVGRPDDGRWIKPAARLSADLIAPIESAGWLHGVNRLQVVPHGALTYLPFALLPRQAGGDGALLIDRYTVTYLPAASALLRKPAGRHAASTLLAVAPSRGGLRYAPEEARAVDALFRPASRVLLGLEATEGRFKQLAGGFRMLHLATHSHFNAANPLLSGLELEPDGDDDGMLRVHEILDLKLGADLVTLSACDTALGAGYFASLPRGDGFVGLNRAFLAAGSAAVMATLWQVDDRASVSLMKRFYRGLDVPRGRGDAATALAVAQREYRRSRELGHPYYWAAYVVVGQVRRDLQVAGRPAGRRS